MQENRLQLELLPKTPFQNRAYAVEIVSSVCLLGRYSASRMLFLNLFLTALTLPLSCQIARSARRTKAHSGATWKRRFSAGTAETALGELDEATGERPVTKVVSLLEACFSPELEGTLHSPAALLPDDGAEVGGGAKGR